MTTEDYLDSILRKLNDIDIDNRAIRSNTELITAQTININEQLTESGDSILLNNIQQNRNGIALIAIIGALFILYYFVMRCLK